VQRRERLEAQAQPRGQRIELEFQVDSNRVGQTWHVRIRENGALIFTGTRVTKAPSGSFTVRRLGEGPRWDGQASRGRDERRDRGDVRGPASIG
jgi:hypothetical protein